MVCKTELGAASRAALAARATNALNETHQKIRQLIDVIIAANSDNLRLQAVKALETLQHQFIELVLQVTQHSDSAKQCSVATARYLGYDCTATHKAAECLRLEQSAGFLHQYHSVKPYSRLHPRYTINRQATTPANTKDASNRSLHAT